MSIEMEQAADAILQAAGHLSSQDDLSDVEIEGDGSSSLSDIEEKDIEQDDDVELSDELSNPSDDENDSEAETERLEDSPNKFRPHRDVVLNSHNTSQIYERSPSKLNKQFTIDDLDDEDEEDHLSDDGLSINESLGSPKSSNHEEGEAHAPTTAATSLEDESTTKSLLALPDGDSKKRKRSIMAGSTLDIDLEEPVRKRTGSIMAPVDDYAVEDEIEAEDEIEQSNPQSGNISDEEENDAQEKEPQIEPAPADDEPEIADAPPSPKRRGRRKKKGAESGLDTRSHEEERDDGGTPNGEHSADHEIEDEAEANAKNEEEMERKRLAFEQLGDIEKHFALLKERLYDERLAQLNKEEAMLKQSKPTHPDLLAMIKCLDEKRDERIRLADKRRQLDLQTLKNFAVAGRSQILSQYQQEVRESREQHLEQVGKQWYEIQHDRRSYAGGVPDYTIKFPTKRSQQLQNQIAYSTEVSVLAGVSKYVGFPAAPPMRPATSTEIEEDFAKMGRIKPVRHAISSIPFQELAALRSAGASRYKPAEEQFIEQTPWANPQHPSHAHLLNRQASAHQTPRTSSPFSSNHAVRQNGPISGTFSTNSALSQNPNGRVSPLNPFTNSHAIVPSPLGSRQPSESPQLNKPSVEARPGAAMVQDVPISLGIPAALSRPRDFPKEARREQAVVGQY